MARKSPRPKSQQPESRVILVDLTRADWKPIDPRKRSVEVEQCIAFLSERIRGQPKGIEAIADAYELYLSGEQDPRYPICKFLFLGPSGTGKTQLVRTFALFLFGDESAMTRIDCSEYVHRADVTRLLGSSPGYIRSDEIPILAQQRLDYPAWKALHEPRLRQLRSQQQAVENARPKKEKDLKDAQRALRQAATEAARRKLQNEVTQLASELQRIESERQAIEQEISQLVFRPGQALGREVLVLGTGRDVCEALDDLFEGLLRIDGLLRRLGGVGEGVGEASERRDVRLDARLDETADGAEDVRVEAADLSENVIEPAPARLVEALGGLPDRGPGALLGERDGVVALLAGAGDRADVRVPVDAGEFGSRLLGGGRRGRPDEREPFFPGLDLRSLHSVEGHLSLSALLGFSNHRRGVRET